MTITRNENTILLRLTMSPVHENVFDKPKLRRLKKHGYIMHQVDTYYLTSTGRLLLEKMNGEL